MAYLVGDEFGVCVAAGSMASDSIPIGFSFMTARCGYGSSVIWFWQSRCSVEHVESTVPPAAATGENSNFSPKLVSRRHSLSLLLTLLAGSSRLSRYVAGENFVVIFFAIFMVICAIAL